MMARDRNAQERIETVLYHACEEGSGDVAEELYHDEVAPLEAQIKALTAERDALAEKLAMAAALLEDIATQGRCEFAVVRATLAAIKEGTPEAMNKEEHDT